MASGKRLGNRIDWPIVAIFGAASAFLLAAWLIGGKR